MLTWSSCIYKICHNLMGYIIYKIHYCEGRYCEGSYSCENSHILLTGFGIHSNFYNHMFIIVWLCASVHSANFHQDAMTGRNYMLVCWWLKQQKLLFAGKHTEKLYLAQWLFVLQYCMVIGSPCMVNIIWQQYKGSSNYIF